MKIAVLSGKGGTGKTFVSVNLTCVSDNAMYLDCDVEEPNGHLFFKPQDVKEEKVTVKLPKFDFDKCTGCRNCVDLCRFNALAFVKDKVILFPDICHSCGLCSIVCKFGAISEHDSEVGKILTGTYKDKTVVTGKLNIGEASGVPVIKSVLQKSNDCENAIIDCPPGSACTTMESVSESDYCIIVAEPTEFGVHNFKMVHELVTLLGKKVGVVINKYESEDNLMEKYCKENNIKILARIPYKKDIALATSKGMIGVEVCEDAKGIFQSVLKQVEAEVNS